MNQLNTYSTITLRKDKVVAHHTSDGSELIPSEIQEGMINNYATEPDLHGQTISPQNNKSVMFF